MLTQRVPSERKGIKDERQEKGLFEYELDHNCSYGICANAACSFYALYTLSGATTAYSKITYSVTYANEALEFKERMDYSMYLAVVRKMAFEELGDGEMTVNGIVTVNPYEYIGEMEKAVFDVIGLSYSRH